MLDEGPNRVGFSRRSVTRASNRTRGSYRDAGGLLGDFPVFHQSALDEDVRDLQARGYDVVAADAQDFDLGQRFDTVVAGEIIEHLSDVGGFLDSVHQHLEPDGHLVRTTPNPWTFHRFRRALFGDVPSNPEHTCWFDERTLRQVLERHSFEIDSVTSVRPTDAGLTRLLYDIGRETIGGTSLLVVAHPRA